MDLQDEIKASVERLKAEGWECQPCVVDLPKVVSELVDVLGGAMVGVIGGVRSTREVGEWMRGERGVDREHEMRFLNALQTVRTLKLRHRDAAVRAWFIGANHWLKDEAPVAVLAAMPVERGEDVIGAAGAFISY